MMRKASLFLPAICLGIFSPAATPVAFATALEEAASLDATIAPAMADSPGAYQEASSTQFPRQISEWHGCARYDFNLHGRDCIVVVPQHAAPGNPWIWRPAFFDAFPSVDIALLEKGFHIAYMDLTHLYGSPRAVELGTKFCNSMHEDFGLSDKVVVEGFSRGGYFAFNWAAANPDKVACLYVDAPVCDITSWPGKAQEDLWQGFLTEWGISDALPGDRFEGNALSKVQVLAQNKIPIISVCGLADKTVPYEDNFKKVYEALITQGGIVEQILKEDCDHHPHSLENPEPIVDFITRHITGPTN